MDRGACVQNAKQIVCSLLGLQCDYRISANIISDEYFDYYVFPVEKFAIYAYNYELDGAGMGLHDVGSRTSHLWPFEGRLEEPDVRASYYVRQMESILANERCFLVFDERVQIVYDSNRRNEKDFKSLQDIIRLYESGRPRLPRT
jgi:hypothetical protein